MAHFARIKNGSVVDMHVVANAVLTDDNGQESEARGQQFLAELWQAAPEDFVQCSYNGNPVGGFDRGGYPGIGWHWDGQQFVAPQQPETPVDPNAETP